MPVGNQSAGGSGGGATAGAIRAGRAVVEIGGDDSRLAKVLAGARAKVLALGAAFQKIGGLSLGVGAGFLAPLSALLGSGIERADRIGDLADVFGLTAESASRMASAFELAGGSIDEMEMSLSKLAALSKDGEPLDETLLRVADALGEIDDAAERFQAAKEIFGAKFAGKFVDTGADVRGMLGRGQTISAEEIANAKKFKAAMAEAGIAVKSALLPVLQYLAPVAKLVATFVRANAGLLVTVFAVATGLLAFGAATAAAGVALSGAVAVVGLVGAAVGFLLTPVGLVVAAVVGMGAAFFTQSERGQEAAGDLGAAFQSMGASFGATWGGILAAVRAGDLKLAFEILSAGVRAVWYEMVLALGKALAAFVEDARTKLTVVAGIMGAMKGAKLGARLGPWGLAGGLLLGGAGGAWAGDRLADEGAKLGNMPETEAALARAKADLAALAGRAAGLAKPGGVDELADMKKRHPELAAVANQIKGGFATFGVAQARFGFGDTVEQDQLKALIDLKDGNGKLPDKIAAAVAVAFALK